MDPSEIRRIREKLGLTQGELAEVFGLAGATVISNIETGFRNPSTTKILLLRLLDSLSEHEAKDLLQKLLYQARLYRD